MSHFRWTGDVLFNGLKIPADKLPWFYLPEWLCISIPVSWLAAGIVGGIWVMEALFKKPLACIRNTPERFYLTCAGLFVLPLLLIIGMHSVVYDDWRHVYFIYVPFVILALFAINKLLEGKGKWAVHFLCALQVFLVASFMITSHPFQSVYFNELVSRNKEYLRDHFEMEYWACSHKQGLEYILAHDTSSVIRVTMYPIDQNLMMLSGKDRNRIVSAGLGEHPDYFMTTFRTHPGEYEYTDVFYEIKALNSTILRVYKLHK